MKLIIHTGYNQHLGDVVQFPDHLHPKAQRAIFVEYCNNNEFVEIKSNSPYLQGFIWLSMKAQKVGFTHPTIPHITKPVEWEIRDYHEVGGQYKLVEAYYGMPSDDNLLNDELGNGNCEYFNLLDYERNKEISKGHERSGTT